MEVGKAEVTQLGSALLVALVGVAYGLQRMLKGWKENSTEISIITLMHKELERMATQNKALSEELNRLQLELIKLNVELQKLTLENQKLHSDVGEITAQLTRLQSF